MPGSSELSDALNPYFYEQEQQTRVNVSPNYERIPVPSPSAVPQRQPLSQPHRSALADAINPAAASTSAFGALRRSSRQPAQDPIQLLKGLIQSIASYKAAVEQEKKRRLTWEQEQEAKYITRQTELEKRVAELQHELDTLKAERELLKAISAHSSNSAHESSDTNASFGTSQVPGESVMLFSPAELPEFVEGSSTPTIATQKRPRSRSPNDSSEQESTKPRLLRSSRAQTIHAAMRVHILDCMGLDHDKELPPSHDETTLLPPTYPVRFVWDQTTKKSQHNARMKTRILTDMMKNKHEYPLIPAEDFTLSKLDGVFEQFYTTLRQKYASQQGNGIKSYSQDRAENKARKARRLSRKKIKLANRTTTRKGLQQYKSPEFDFAFQLDCMSSEESSEGETDTPNGNGNNDKTQSPGGKALRIRFFAWRSSRLKELYRSIDEYEQSTRDTKPKRGIGRKNRFMGLPKDGNPPPPKGTPSWMVSKKWLRQATLVNPQITTLINLGGGDETTASVLDVLGEESEDEGRQLDTVESQNQSQSRNQNQNPNQVIPVIPAPVPIAGPESKQPDFTQMPDYSMIPPLLPLPLPMSVTPMAPIPPMPPLPLSIPMDPTLTLNLNPNPNPNPNPNADTDDPYAHAHAQYMYAQHPMPMWTDSMVGYVDLSQFTSPLMQPYPPLPPPPPLPTGPVVQHSQHSQQSQHSHSS